MSDDISPDALTISEVGILADGQHGVILHGSQAAVKRAAALFGEPVMIRPVEPSDEQERDAAQDELVTLQICLDRALRERDALRAALAATGGRDD